MRYLPLQEDATTAILIKDTLLKSKELNQEYADLVQANCCAVSLEYDKKKPSAQFRKDCVAKLLPFLCKKTIDYVLCADGEYFKTLVGVQKLTGSIGEVYPIKGAEHIKCMYVPSYGSFFVNPDAIKLRDRILPLFNDLTTGSFQRIGEDVLRSVSYPKSVSEIRDALANLHQYDALTADIEAFSLKHYDAGIGSISFSQDEHSAVTFLVDFEPCDEYKFDWWCPKDKIFKEKSGYGKQVFNAEVRALLKEFLEAYQGVLIWHNVTYDAYVLTYQLWMNDLLDQEGMLTGLEVMTRNFECTQLITYLATNSCAGNHLGLKDQSQEFTGNYAEDVQDIRMIPVDRLLKYNAIDTCATWFVMDKHYDTVVLDDQLDIYQNVFKPSVLDIIQMQLTGMCLDMDQVLLAETEIATECANAELALQGAELTDCMERLRLRKWENDFEKRKAKAKNPDNIKPKDINTMSLSFNPNSGNQIQVLVYEVLGLPVIETTATKLPATGGKVLKKLLKLTLDPVAKTVLQALINYALGAKILSAFIPAFKAAPLASDGHNYVFGSFKLGGTVSGRLSAQNPNLQTIPSGSHFAKIIKKCFIAPKGWVMLGSDFDGLEDYINTVLTKDPNKIKVLAQGYDGHSFRAAYYWKEKFHFIDMDDPESVLRVKHEYGDWRSKGKPVSFALQYQGTWSTLVKNCGFSEYEAQSIEANYHELYKVSMEWVTARIDQAAIDGYATGAFGLRIRTPVLAQVVMGNSRTPQEAQAEARTLGNAISGQSYGLLNNTSSVRFLKRVRAHSDYRLKVRPCAHIHDAQYMYAKDDFALLAWINKYLIKEMAWQDLPELQCAGLNISSSLDVFYPNWSQDFTIKNGMNQEEIKQLCITEAKKRKEKGVATS